MDKQKEYYKLNKEKIKQQQKLRREEIREYNRQYYLSNKQLKKKAIPPVSFLLKFSTNKDDLIVEF